MGSSVKVLFLIGDGEAGKTSLVNALKSTNNCAQHIRSDHRTVGMDISQWEPKVPGTDSELRFSIFDLAGQAVYSKTHRFFLLRRAVYLYVWRPGKVDLSQLSQTVKYWLDSIQNRMPGSYIMTIATHVDIVDENVVDSQCNFVSQVIREWMSSTRSKLVRDADTPTLNIYDNGHSHCVSSRSGFGIEQLRNKLIQHVTSMPWYSEALPSSWIALKDTLHMARKRQPYLAWEDYVTVTVDCGITMEMLKSATSFLHETGVIRYFGDYSGNDLDSALMNTIYISSDWMMNVMKGLIRHDRQALMDYFVQQQNKIMLRRVNRLNLCGKLHRELFAFLWPEMPQCKDFWSFVRCKGKREAELWKDTILFDEDDIARATALLEGFDLLVKDNEEYIVPSVLPPAMLPKVPSLYIDECPFVVKISYTSLPPGAFDDILVRIVKKEKLLVEFSSNFASFYYDSHLAQIFFFEVVESFAKSGYTQLVLRSSSKQLFENVIKHIIAVESSIAGLLRLGFDESSLSAASNILGARSQIPWPPCEKISTGEEIACLYCPAKNGHNFSSSDCLQNWRKLLGANEDSVPSTAAIPTAIPTASGSLPMSCLPACVQRHRTRQDSQTETGESTPDPVVTCPICSHKHNLFELFNIIRTKDLRECPRCLQYSNINGELGSFSLGECRLQFNESDSMRTNSVICHYCLASGGSGLYYVMDVSPAEMFASGLGQFTQEEQTQVSILLGRIEQELDVLCCNRSGQIELQRRQSLLVLSGHHEALARLKASTFVLIFFSDEYVISEKCQDELKLALHLCKLVVPVLMPDNGLKTQQGVSLGWSGPKDKNYWRHAQQVFHQHKMDEGSIQWSVLSLFAPITFPESVEETACAQFVATVTERIKPLLQRQGKMDVYSDFSKIGVNVSYFARFIADCGGHDSLKGLSTQEVVQKFVFCRTKTSKLSLCDHLLAEDPTCRGKYVHTAEWFYSHAWQYMFLDTIEAARLYFHGTDPVIWFDVFSVSQHRSQHRPFEWWTTTFLNAVGDIGKVLMLMQPLKGHETPAWTTLTRVWCVFELFACESTKSQLHITMTERMHSKLLSVLAGNTYDFLGTMFEIDCEQSSSFKSEDKERVFDAIYRTIGFSLLNSLVIGVMEKWLYSELFTLIEEKPYLETRLLMTMTTICSMGLERRKRMPELGNEHPDTLASMHALAGLFKYQGFLKEAEKLLLECCQGRERVLGSNHALTSLSAHELAQISEAGSTQLESIQAGSAERLEKLKFFLGAYNEEWKGTKQKHTPLYCPQIKASFVFQGSSKEINGGAWVEPPEQDSATGSACCCRQQ